MTSECQVRAQAKYDKEHTVRRSLKLNTRTDQDIIQWMWYQKSVQGSIKRLIREEIAREEAKKP
ncbi:MAG: hypothetical protein K6A68_12875 [Clostridiales bacterium]|nr:hypothetical protein [Clostridiales bacterium]